MSEVIVITTGKGGVGKAMATASLANMLAARGYRVGIMDADITGPSIPNWGRWPISTLLFGGLTPWE